MLIADCNASIKDCLRLLEIAEGRTGENRTKRIAELQSELQRQKIALASLEADAIHQAKGSSGWRDVNGRVAEAVAKEGIPVRVFYASPPVQVMRPVALDERFDFDFCDRLEPSKDGAWMHYDSVVSAIRAAGGEVK